MNDKRTARVHISTLLTITYRPEVKSALLYTANGNKSVAFVDTLAMRADFCIKFYTGVKQYTLYHQVSLNYIWKWQYSAVSERVPYLGALGVCSRQGAIQIHVYLYLYVHLSTKTTPVFEHHAELAASELSQVDWKPPNLKPLTITSGTPC